MNIEEKCSPRDTLAENGGEPARVLKRCLHNVLDNVFQNIRDG
jgi:hypothetical protein